MLSKEQVDQYHSEGYVVARSLIDEVALDQLRELVSEMLVGAEELTEHNEKFDLEPSHKASEPKVRRIKTPHKWHSFFLGFKQVLVYQSSFTFSGSGFIFSSRFSLQLFTKSLIWIR